MKKGNPNVPVSSVSDPRLSKTVTPSSAETTSPDFVTILSVPNRQIGISSPPLSNTNPSVVVSGSAEGVGIVPPPTAEVSAADFSTLTDRVQRSLKRSSSQRSSGFA